MTTSTVAVMVVRGMLVNGSPLRDGEEAHLDAAEAFELAQQGWVQFLHLADRAIAAAAFRQREAARMRGAGLPVGASLKLPPRVTTVQSVAEAFEVRPPSF